MLQHCSKISFKKLKFIKHVFDEKTLRGPFLLPLMHHILLKQWKNWSKNIFYHQRSLYVKQGFIFSFFDWMNSPKDIVCGGRGRHKNVDALKTAENIRDVFDFLSKSPVQRCNWFLKKIQKQSRSGIFRKK